MIYDKLKGASVFELFSSFLMYWQNCHRPIWAYIYDGNYGLVAAIWGIFGAEALFAIADPICDLFDSNRCILEIFWTA